MTVAVARRRELRRLARQECAEIIESAIGVDLGIYSKIADRAEQDVIENEMRRVSDGLYRRSAK